MIFWRQKNNASAQDQEAKEDRILHHKSDPQIEPSTDYDTDLSRDIRDALRPTEHDILEDLDEIPDHLRSEPSESGGGWLSRLAHGLAKSSNKLTQGITDIFTKSAPDEDVLAQLEDVLIEADLGPHTAVRLCDLVADQKFDVGAGATPVLEALAQGIEKILQPCAVPLKVQKPAEGPFTILICGVNGVGKTTTIGKLAKQFHVEQHKKVLIAAADTFRAAAVDQLKIWGERAHVPVLARDIGADAAAVAFESYEEAARNNVDVLIIDTAGRLQNKTNLMEELQKIVRVLKKKDVHVPQTVLLVLDATTGQNAFSQVETFKEMVHVTGLIVNKLDGSAKGGVVVGLADKFKLPIVAIGVGEGIEDLRAFNARSFSRALLGLAD